jgi:glycosyltransferase involved in cell wall biosynthesis
MRIAHVTDVYLPRLGGIEMQVHDLATRQRHAGLDVDVLTTTPPAGFFDTSAPPDPDWVRRVGPASLGFTGRSMSSTLSAHQLMKGDPYDVVHVHASVWSPFATAAAIATSRAGLPTVITMHSLWAGLGPLPRLADLSMRLRSWPVVWSAVSEKAAQPLRRAMGNRVPVAVFPNGIDARVWQVEPSPREPDIVTVTSVMRLISRKRPLPLLRMMRHVRALVPPDVKIRLVLVGDGPQRAAVTRYLDLHGMADWVTLSGRLDRAEIRRIFAASDVYVAPAELESFGIAALEARSAGLPVVASSRGGVDEFVDPGREGLLAADDAEMVNALVTMIADSTLRETVSAHNREVPPMVTWDAVLDRAQQFYAQAAAQRGVSIGRPSVMVDEPAPAVPEAAL